MTIFHKTMAEPLTIGIDFSSGATLQPGASENTGLLRSPREAASSPRLTTAHLKPIDLSTVKDSGWCIVFPKETDSDIYRALAPLRHRREDEAGNLYKELAFQDGLQESSTFQFLHRLGCGAGSLDPLKLPYYILIVGSPEEISFSVQQELSATYAVGRLHFDHAESYRQYALKAVSDQQERTRAQTLFCAAEHNGAPALQVLHNDFFPPILDQLSRVDVDCNIVKLFGHAATKKNLIAALRERLDIALLAGHGVTFPIDRPEQFSHQGDFVCQDWPGMSWPLDLDHCLQSDDLPTELAHGLILFLLTTCGAGTPKHSNYRNLQRAQQNAQSGFLSALAKTALSRGALAVIGHLGQLWDTSISFLHPSSEIATYANVINELLAGTPAGHAMRHFQARYNALACIFINEVHGGKIKNGPQLVPRDEDTLWLALEDARNYILLGDPAYRLPHQSCRWITQENESTCISVNVP